MRERQHCNAVVVLNERESITELTVVNEAIHSANGADKLVHFQLTIEQSVQIYDVEA